MTSDRTATSGSTACSPAPHDARLREQARRRSRSAGGDCREGYNHIGDPTWDAREGGRLLLPLECYRQGSRRQQHLQARHAIGVADPLTLRWRFLVDRPGRDREGDVGRGVTGRPAGLDVNGGVLLAYRTTAIHRTAGPLRRRAPLGRRAAGHQRGRLLRRPAAGRGQRRRRVRGQLDRPRHRRPPAGDPAARQALESEGLDVVDNMGGVLHWIVRPLSGQGNVLLHYTPTTPRGRLRLTARPAVLTAATRTRVRFRAMRRPAGWGPWCAWRLAGSGPVPPARPA